MDRKRIIKYLGLTGALALCLVLSSCYIAPDDINTGVTVTTGGSLPFQTLAPTPTVEVTPDTVVIETQNPNNNVWGNPGNTGNTAQQTIAVIDSSATPTPTPDAGGAGWNDWGTVAGTDSNGNQVTATPNTSTVVFQTPTPSGVAVVTPTPRTTTAVTKAPATPTPTPPSLQVGFTNSAEVRALQKRLKELGYYTGSVDGDFGAGTEAAVKAFQKDNGLTADGKAGSQTLAKLNSKNAKTKKEANATATPKATAKKTATPTKKVTATPRPTATPNLSKEYYLQTGSSGSKVKTLQNRLIELGYLGGTATGTYDASTRAAVMAFQKKTRGLYDDGVAGPETLAALYSSSAAKASSVAASTGETLQLGSEGGEVRALQKRLKELGFLNGAVDASYGVATEAAVRAFQQNNGLTADGKAGNATLNALYAQDAVKSNGTSASGSTSNSGSGNSTAASGTGRTTSDISSTGYATLQSGSQGDAVKKLQSELKKLGYYSGSVDGSYGEDTVAAVLRFQLRNNLTVDGKAGPATQRALYGSTETVAYSALREGESGAAVRTLQYTLYELGYYDGKIDGDYGQTTADAVRAFQIQNHLKPVDGVAGTNTLARMYSSQAVPASAAAVDYDTQEAGMSGELVVEIQDCLIQMGYDLEITGVYDEATVAAVKQFQRDKGLVQDGKAGEQTLVYLFGY